MSMPPISSGATNTSFVGILADGVEPSGMIFKYYVVECRSVSVLEMLAGHPASLVEYCFMWELSVRRSPACGELSAGAAGGAGQGYAGIASEAAATTRICFWPPPVEIIVPNLSFSVRG